MDVREALDEATFDRLQRAASEDVSRRLRLQDVQPGDVGVLHATVRQVAAPRSFSRKNGTEGLIGRVTMDDGTGEMDLVLWDGENQHVRDGTLAPGRNVVLRGVAAKAGYRSGVELALGAAVIEAAPAQDISRLKGTLTQLEPTQIIDGRFQVQATLSIGGREERLIAWDDDVKGLVDAGVGALVEVAAAPHPLLDGIHLVAGGIQSVGP